jgi:hypothetical protein
MQFFVLEVVVGDPFETSFCELKPANIGEGKDRQACPVCGEHLGMLPWFPPYRAEITGYGKGLGDVAFGSGNGLLLSARFKSAWEANGLRGLDFAPVERTRIRPARLGKKSASYFYVAPRRFGARIDVKRSRIDYSAPFECEYCLHAGFASARGFTIDESSWTGEDMFYAWGDTGSIIVSDRVRELRDKHGLTNINLTPTEEYFWDPLNKWTPVDYSRDDMPEYEYVTEEDPPTN